MLVGAESYKYDASSNQLLWEGIQNLGQEVVGFADTEEEALDLAFKPVDSARLATNYLFVSLPKIGCRVYGLFIGVL